MSAGLGGGDRADQKAFSDKTDLSNRMNLTAVRHCLGDWFRLNQRDLPWRRTADPYAIWVSEVMLQQTQVVAVIPYYFRFISRFPDVFRLAKADLQEVLKIWEGMGYYARARNLHKAANMVVDRHDGRVPDDPAAFRALPGVGDYIAAAVLSIAFSRPLAVTDGNVKRVISRLYKVDAPINKSASYEFFRQIADALLDHDDPGMFNQAMMELGALICRPKNPDCRACPLTDACRAHQDRTVTSYPVREKKPPVPERRQAVGVVFRRSRVLIVRRPENGLLGGLWEFPGGDIMDNESPEVACIRVMREQVGLDVAVATRLTRIRHTYSHFRLHADVFICEILSRRENSGNPKKTGTPLLSNGSGGLTDKDSHLIQDKFIENKGAMVAENAAGYDDSEATGTSEKMNGRAAWVNLHELDRYPFHRAAAGVKSLILTVA